MATNLPPLEVQVSSEVIRIEMIRAAVKLVKSLSFSDPLCQTAREFLRTQFAIPRVVNPENTSTAVVPDSINKVRDNFWDKPLASYSSGGSLACWHLTDVSGTTSQCGDPCDKRSVFFDRVTCPKCREWIRQNANTEKQAEHSSKTITDRCEMVRKQILKRRKEEKPRKHLQEVKAICSYSDCSTEARYCFQDQIETESMLGFKQKTPGLYRLYCIEHAPEGSLLMLNIPEVPYREDIDGA